jgi:ribokinase
MIIVFGSINIDLVTRVDALPKAGETVASPGYALVPGGKGANQALAARRAGAEVVMVGAVGRDGFADLALDMLAADGVDLTRVVRADAPTGAAFIAVDGEGRNQIVVASGANALAQASALDGLAAKAGDILLLQWEVPDAEILAAARWAKAAGLRVMLNRAPAGPATPELLALTDIVVVNEHEVMALAEGHEVDASDPEAVASGLSARYGNAVFVTLGAEGAMSWADGIRHAAPALSVEVVDTTAAGDTFCGAFAAALDRRRGYETAIEFASAAGSLACTAFGAQPSIPRLATIEPAAANLAEGRNPDHRRTPP